METRTSPELTVSPLFTLMEATVPSCGATISFSIFMASRMTSTSPALTEAPAATFKNGGVIASGYSGELDELRIRRMEKRAELMDEVRVTSRAGSGTTVHLRRHLSQKLR